MDTKKCTKCDTAKPLAEFSKNRLSTDGRQAKCKLCYKAYYKKNKKNIIEQTKRYRKANKESVAEYFKQRYKDNKEAIDEYQKKYYRANKADLAEYRKQYYHANKSDMVQKGVDYAKERRATDPLFRLTHNIRSLIGNSFRNGGFNKNSKTAEILGCTFKEYYEHIEAQFTDGMSWDLMGDIHIDHRLPLSAANTEEEILVLNHYRNLQPMWATDNLAKSDSYCPNELAAYFEKHLPS